MALNEDIGSGARKLLLPAAATVVGAGAGLVLTRKPVRKSIPRLDLGDLADDLRTKVDSAIGKARSTSHSGRRIDSRELHQRVREREKRRNSRRART